MMHTDLRQVRHVVTLARLLNFTKAADELGITQSALTRSIQKLEGAAKITLFDRDRGGVRLTETGRAYVARGAALLDDAQELDRFLNQTALAEVGEVKYGITPLLAQVLMPQILSEELNRGSEIKSIVTIRSVDTLLELLLSDKIEFCLCAERPVPPPNLRSTIMGAIRFSLLVRSEHPLLLAPDGRTSKDFPLIMSGNLLNNGQFPANMARFISRKPRIVIDDFGILSRITAGTDAIWLSSAQAASAEIGSGALKELPLSESGTLGGARVILYSMHRRSLSPAAKRLTDLVRREMARL